MNSISLCFSFNKKDPIYSNYDFNLLIDIEQNFLKFDHERCQSEFGNYKL